MPYGGMGQMGMQAGAAAAYTAQMQAYQQNQQRMMAAQQMGGMGMGYGAQMPQHHHQQYAQAGRPAAVPAAGMGMGAPVPQAGGFSLGVAVTAADPFFGL
jgi:hypothetical protein